MSQRTDHLEQSQRSMSALRVVALEVPVVDSDTGRRLKVAGLHARPLWVEQDLQTVRAGGEGNHDDCDTRVGRI